MVLWHLEHAIEEQRPVKLVSALCILLKPVFQEFARDVDRHCRPFVPIGRTTYSIDLSPRSASGDGHVDLLSLKPLIRNLIPSTVSAKLN
jgi:hypothetical protein